MGSINTVHIAAGGESSRLREKITSLSNLPNYPKHLLPTGGPNGETFLGRIVRQAKLIPHIGSIIIHANSGNKPIIEQHPDIEPPAKVIDAKHSSSLGPITGSLLATRSQTLGSAGDFYAEWDWQSMIDWHNSRPNPVTFLVGQTVAVESGAVFELSASQQIVGLKRVERTTESDLINIGAYIIEPEREVIKILSQMAKSRAPEDVVANTLIDRGLVGAYLAPGKAFNVNTPQTYSAVLEHTALKVAV